MDVGISVHIAFLTQTILSPLPGVSFSGAPFPADFYLTHPSGNRTMGAWCPELEKGPTEPCVIPGFKAV